jgi:hypothetical protein
MSSLPRPPASCADLDLAVVERTLAKHYSDITGAARELGVSGPDLKRLTWAKPQLLEEADLERMGVISQVWHVLITALDSDDWRRKMWASDRIMSSWIARDHPLAPARRRSAAVTTTSATPRRPRPSGCAMRASSSNTRQAQRLRTRTDILTTARNWRAHLFTTLDRRIDLASAARLITECRACIPGRRVYHQCSMEMQPCLSRSTISL